MPIESDQPWSIDPGPLRGDPHFRAGLLRNWSAEDTVKIDHPYYFTQDTAGVEGGAEPNDEFGYSLASGDFDDDGYADLAIVRR